MALVYGVRSPLAPGSLGQDRGCVGRVALNAARCVARRPGDRRIALKFLRAPGTWTAVRPALDAIFILGAFCGEDATM